MKKKYFVDRMTYTLHNRPIKGQKEYWESAIDPTVIRTNDPYNRITQNGQYNSKYYYDYYRFCHKLTPYCSTENLNLYSPIILKHSLATSTIIGSYLSLADSNMTIPLGKCL